MSSTGNLKFSEADVPPNWSKRRAKVLLVQMRHSPRAPFITHIFADFKYVSYEIILIHRRAPPRGCSNMGKEKSDGS